jgi:hypothetical protein
MSFVRFSLYAGIGYGYTMSDYVFVLKTNASRRGGGWHSRTNRRIFECTGETVASVRYERLGPYEATQCVISCEARSIADANKILRAVIKLRKSFRHTVRGHNIYCMQATN